MIAGRKVSLITCIFHPEEGKLSHQLILVTPSESKRSPGLRMLTLLVKEVGSSDLTKGQARDQEQLVGLDVSVITVVRAFHTKGGIKVVQL